MFPRLAECRALAELKATATDAQVLASGAVRGWFAEWLQRLNREATGSANRVEWLALQPELPSIDLGEITDKGSLNQRAVLRARASQVEALYRGFEPQIIRHQAVP